MSIKLKIYTAMPCDENFYEHLLTYQSQYGVVIDIPQKTKGDIELAEGEIEKLYYGIVASKNNHEQTVGFILFTILKSPDQTNTNPHKIEAELSIGIYDKFQKNHIASEAIAQAIFLLRQHPKYSTVPLLAIVKRTNHQFCAIKHILEKNNFVILTTSEDAQSDFVFQHMT